ncbi:hypothetical protein M0802_012480 [Mischocyttarus mexicanus]|nr:hypothetical protein M0802_012480 [Mischocyttarus mexicanus]
MIKTTVNKLNTSLFLLLSLRHCPVFSPTTVQLSWHCFGGLPSTLLVFSFWVSATLVVDVTVYLREPGQPNVVRQPWLDQPNHKFDFLNNVLYLCIYGGTDRESVINTVILAFNTTPTGHVCLLRGSDVHQVKIKQEVKQNLITTPFQLIFRRNLNNLGYADDTILLTEKHARLSEHVEQCYHTLAKNMIQHSMLRTPNT